MREITPMKLENLFAAADLADEREQVLKLMDAIAKCRGKLLVTVAIPEGSIEVDVHCQRFMRCLDFLVSQVELQLKAFGVEITEESNGKRND